jgi:ADP-heptose:LPS heptosyltransferase
MVTFLPTLRGIAWLHPEAALTLVCTPVGRDVARGCVPRLDFITVDKRDTQHWLRAGRATLSAVAAGCGKRFDVSLHSYDEPSFSYLLARLLRVPRRIGFDSAIARLQSFLTDTVPMDRSRHVIDINYELVRRLGDCTLVPMRTPLAVEATARDTVAQKLLDAGIRGPFVALHGGAKLGYREWGSSKYLALAERLESRIPAVVIEDGTKRFVAARHRVETSSIGELAALLENAAVFVGNNSGPMHVAAAMGTRCVVIAGPSAHNWGWYWRDVPHTYLQDQALSCAPCESLGAVPGRCLNSSSPKRCLEQVTVDIVEKATWELLDR